MTVQDLLQLIDQVRDHAAVGILQLEGVAAQLATANPRMMTTKEVERVFEQMEAAVREVIQITKGQTQIATETANILGQIPEDILNQVR